MSIKCQMCRFTADLDRKYILKLSNDRIKEKIGALPHNASLLDVRSNLPDDKDIVEKNDLRLFSSPAELVVWDVF